MERFEAESRLIQVHDEWQSTSPSNAVLDAISDAENTGPLELGFVLYDRIDPEALDSLLMGHGESAIEISFRVGDYRVWIDDETLTIVRGDDR